MRKFVLPILLLVDLAIFLPYSSVGFDSWGELFSGSVPLDDLSYGLRDYCETLVSQSAPLLILSVGMTIVLMTAGIDLSVGSMVALVACVMSNFAESGNFWLTAAPVGLGLAVGLGYFNGLLIARLDIPPIIATLGTLFFYRGLCDAVMIGHENLVPVPEWCGGATGAAGIVLSIIVPGGLYFRWSRWRREILLLGGNRIAARYAGIPVSHRIEQVYALMGLLVFFAACVASSRDMSVNASWQSGLELKVIVAVVLGGTRVDGGFGSIAGSLLGVLLIAVMETGLMGAQRSELMRVLLGPLLVLGVWLNMHAENTLLKLQRSA
jgi:ribose/xylose/arabinose/galactoside ABC-type transport system permease subunit